MIRGRWQRITISKDHRFLSELKVSGNYAIFIGGHLRYIGETKNLALRISNHLNSIWRFFPYYDDIEIKVRIEKDIERYEVEYNLISRLRPSGNRQDLVRLKRHMEAIKEQKCQKNR